MSTVFSSRVYTALPYQCSTLNLPAAPPTMSLGPFTYLPRTVVPGGWRARDAPRACDTGRSVRCAYMHVAVPVGEGENRISRTLMTSGV